MDQDELEKARARALGGGGDKYHQKNADAAATRPRGSVRIESGEGCDAPAVSFIGWQAERGRE
jgi:hypothetical protein